MTAHIKLALSLHNYNSDYNPLVIVIGAIDYEGEIVTGKKNTNN